MADTTQSANALTFTSPFNTLRVIVRDAEPWFVAADVCVALGIENNRDALARLDDEERGVGSTDTLGGRQSVGIVSESGLYSLILGSRKPEAKRFKKWVTAEVLPSIRRTGQFGVAAAADGGAVAELQRRVDALSNRILASKPRWAAIGRYRALGLSVAEIGRLLGLSHTTVEHEITRINAAGLALPGRGSALRRDVATKGAAHG